MKLWAADEKLILSRYAEGKFQIANNGELEKRIYADALAYEGIAIIPVHGILFKDDNYFTDCGWGCSYSWLIDQMYQAVEDQAIKYIGLDIDSPGGEFDGIVVLNDEIKKISKMKSTFSHVSSMAASGGYWIASATDYIAAHRGAYIGSIGVIATLCDFSKKLEDMGIKEYIFVSEVSPEKHADLTTEEGQAMIQNHVDEAGELFVNEMAANRQIKKSTVLTDFGKGNIMFSEKALQSGMIDRVADLETVIDEILNLETEQLI